MIVYTSLESDLGAIAHEGSIRLEATVPAEHGMFAEIKLELTNDEAKALAEQILRLLELYENR